MGVIQSFSNKKTEQLYAGKLKKGFPAQLKHRAMLKLDQLAAANTLDDLRLPRATGSNRY